MEATEFRVMIFISADECYPVFELSTSSPDHGEVFTASVTMPFLRKYHRSMKIFNDMQAELRKLCNYDA